MMDLVERVNRLVAKHSLPVPRLASSHFIDYRLWSALFANVFGIQCEPSLRTVPERTAALRSCLNGLESMAGVSLDHIKPDLLLNHHLGTQADLLEIAELWNDPAALPPPPDTLLKPARSEPNVHRTGQADSSKAYQLVEQLQEALKSQILALEIVNKVKEYLGDVTATYQRKPNGLLVDIRAPRQSIVRTRAIQPGSLTFDFYLTRDERRNPILSVELDRWFPELNRAALQPIRVLEQKLLLLEQRLRRRGPVQAVVLWAVERQRRQDREQSDYRKCRPSTALQREMRSNRALVQEDVKRFHKSAKAAYLNARSHLERILVEEFKKVNHQQRSHLTEIRSYIRSHPHMDWERVSNILDKLK